MDILAATDEQREWVAMLLAGSEPWLQLGSSVEQCQIVTRDKEYLVYVARLNQILCGAIILHPKGLASSPYIKSIVVAEPYRGRQIGTRLIEFAESYFRPKSKHLFLCVSSFNNKARDLYHRLGYQAVGEFKDYVIEGESEVLLHKALR